MDKGNKNGTGTHSGLSLVNCSAHLQLRQEVDEGITYLFKIQQVGHTMSEYGFQDAEYPSEYLMAAGNIGLNGQFHMSS